MFTPFLGIIHIRSCGTWTYLASKSHPPINAEASNNRLVNSGDTPRPRQKKGGIHDWTEESETNSVEKFPSRVVPQWHSPGETSLARGFTCEAM